MMKHFDPHFKDLTDYIIKITAEIWEGRDVGAIRRYYHKDVIMHTPYGDEKGVEPVVQSTLEMLHLFPDRRLLPQDVITDRQGDDYHSSHRIISTMHHRGDGIYGPASNRLVQLYTIADCAVRRNQVYEEWMVRDYKGLILQLGLDPLTFIRENLLSPAAGKRTQKKKAEPKGKTKAAGSEARAYADALVSLWEGKDLAVIRRIYHPGCILYLPGARVCYGHNAADAFFMSYLSAFSDIRLSIDRVTLNQDANMPVRVALRWTVTGRHSGAGLFGSATGAPVRCMGISHAHFHQGRIFCEWTLIDELAIMAQLERKRAT